MRLVLLFFLLIASSVTVATQERSWKPTDPVLHHCEMNVNFLGCHRVSVTKTGKNTCPTNVSRCNLQHT